MADDPPRGPIRVVHTDSGPAGLTSCPRCGAALLLAPDQQDPVDKHQQWHDQLERALRDSFIGL
jgi:hypothetical protein